MMPNYFISSDLLLSRRLERTEGSACVQFAEARRRIFPDSRAEWIESGGVYAVFDGAESPITQSFGLGLFEELSAATLDTIEKFFLDRGAPVFHEISPHAGSAALGLLCARKYRPIEISSVMFRPVEEPAVSDQDIRVRSISAPNDAELWSEVSARGWGHEHPEFIPFLRQFGAITAARKQSVCFLAEVDGSPGAAATLSIHHGVALFGGSATVPESRRRGLHAALLQARMRYAFESGCDLAMMVALAGSDSQRNAERKGFRIAYTRMKWHLDQQQ